MGKQTTEKVVYLLTVQLPPGVSATRFTKYIQEALRSHRGGCDPEDPIYAFKPEEDEIKVKLKERHVQYLT